MTGLTPRVERDGSTVAVVGAYSQFCGLCSGYTRSNATRLPQMTAPAPNDVHMPSGDPTDEYMMLSPA